MTAHRAIKPRRVRPSANVGLFLTVVLLFGSAVWAGVPTHTVTPSSATPADLRESATNAQVSDLTVVADLPQSHYWEWRGAAPCEVAR